MASIDSRTTPRGKTTFRVRFRHDGRPESRTFATRQQAERWAALVDSIGPARAIAELSSPRAATARTVAEQVAHHIEHLSGVTDGTRRGYKRYATDLGPLASLPITALRADDVASWVNGLARERRERTDAPLSAKSIAHRHGLLSAALESAVRDGLIEANVAHGTRLPRDVPTEMTFLTRDELAVLVQHLDPWYVPFVLLLAGTGMRLGEATALEWRHVTLDATPPTVRIVQAHKHTGTARPELGAPKTARSVRTVALPAPVADYLRTRSGKPGDPLMVNRRGGVINSQAFRKDIWTPAAKKLEASHGKRPRIHDLRHSFVAWAIQDGHHLAAIQRQLGHESIKTTIDRYGHLVRSDLDAMASIVTTATAPMIPAAAPEALPG